MVGVAKSVDGEVVAALDDVAEAGTATAQEGRRIAARARRLRAQYIGTGHMHDVVDRERRPRLVEMVSASLARLATAGSRLRRAQATAMQSEGASTSEIARMFGVTRQRVAAILDDGVKRTVQGTTRSSGRGGGHDGSSAERGGGSAGRSPVAAFRGRKG